MWKVKPAPDSVGPKPICVCHFWAKVLLSPRPGIPRGDVLATPQHSGMLLQAQFLLHEHQPHCYIEQWNCRQSALDWEGSGKTKSLWKDQFVGYWEGLRCFCCTQECPEPRWPLHRGGSRNSCGSWGCSTLSFPAPSFPVPLGMSKAAVRTGCGQGRLSLGGDGVRNNPTVP